MYNDQQSWAKSGQLYCWHCEMQRDQIYEHTMFKDPYTHIRPKFLEDKLYLAMTQAFLNFSYCMSRVNVSIYMER